MYVTSIELNNWARYVGTVTVVLGPEVYAVEAQWHDDDERSNWGGKSKFVEAIPYALSGWHRDLGAGAGAEDKVITDGEEEGGVKLTLSTGHVIRRWRQRGKPAKLHLEVPGREKPAIGDAAQELIDQLVGLSQKDFLATCFIRQKQIAKFVTGDQGERAALIAEWCQLAPLQRAAKRAADALTLVIQKREKADARAGALQEMVGRYLPGTYGELTCATAAELAAARAALRELVNEKRGRVDLLRQRREDGITWDARAATMAREASLGAEVEQARQEAETFRSAVPAMPNLEPLFAVHQGAAADMRSKRGLVAGTFDGVCPVGGCACPITEQLNASSDRNRKALAEAEVKERAAKAALDQGQREVSDVRTAERAAERAEGRHRALQEQAAKSKAEKLHGPRPDRVDEMAMVVAERAQREAQEAFTRAEQAERQVIAVLADIGKAQGESAALAVELAELRGAVVALGRSGAQRVIGSAMVGAVEQAANAELASAGIGLVVRVPWERDGAKLAPECEACGTPIKGEATKECPRCHTPRGRQTVLGPFVSLSDRSGAAEDLVGMALQLSAASWLRRKRSVAWSSCVLDEPLSALDRANRMGVAAHLISMLRGRHGFSQAFVISHESGVLDAMPARIIVKAGPKGSTLEVSR